MATELHALREELTHTTDGVLALEQQQKVSRIATELRDTLASLRTAATDEASIVAGEIYDPKDPNGESNAAAEWAHIDDDLQRTFGPVVRAMPDERYVVRRPAQTTTKDVSKPSSLIGRGLSVDDMTSHQQVWALRHEESEQQDHTEQRQLRLSGTGEVIPLGVRHYAEKGSKQPWRFSATIGPNPTTDLAPRLIVDLDDQEGQMPRIGRIALYKPDDPRLRTYARGNESLQLFLERVTDWKAVVIDLRHDQSPLLNGNTFDHYARGLPYSAGEIKDILFGLLAIPTQDYDHTIFEHAGIRPGDSHNAEATLRALYNFAARAEYEGIYNPRFFGRELDVIIKQLKGQGITDLGALKQLFIAEAGKTLAKPSPPLVLASHNAAGQMNTPQLKSLAEVAAELHEVVGPQSKALREALERLHSTRTFWDRLSREQTNMLGDDFLTLISYEPDGRPTRFELNFAYGKDHRPPKQMPYRQPIDIMFDENGDARLIRTHLWLSDQSKIWPPDPRYDSLRKFFGTDPYNRSLTTIDLGRGATPPTITADNGKKRLTYSDGVFRDESGQVVEHMDIERFEEVAGAILHLATAKADELLMLRLQK